MTRNCDTPVNPSSTSFGSPTPYSMHTHEHQSLKTRSEGGGGKEVHVRHEGVYAEAKGVWEWFHGCLCECGREHEAH